LSHWFSAPLPGTDPVGEAWILSDRDDHPSVVAEGPLKGRTIGELMQRSSEFLVGGPPAPLTRFPLLLKFLDVQNRLSVQVHPSDAYPQLIPEGESGKTEAWVVLEKGPEARIFAGLNAGTTASDLLQAIARGMVPEHLASFTPGLGDAVLIPAGTVHSLGDIVVFEVQQNSDVTFRLYDWDRVDPRTGQQRPLQEQQAMACVDFNRGAVLPITPQVEDLKPVLRENLISCLQFGVTRITGAVSFNVGAAQRARVLVCLSGAGRLERSGVSYCIGKGDVFVLPAAFGACACLPRGVVSVLEVSLPRTMRRA
jgi:mannose-6-phosphate isomerase